MHENYISARQYGFRPKRSTVDAIERGKDIVADMSENMVLAVLFDVTGAFDNLKWDKILQELRTRGCREDLHRMVGDYLRDREVTIEDNYPKVIKKIFKGPQGSILGPDFWNITVDRLLNHVETLGGEIFPYADDLILLVGENNRRQIEERAQFYTDAINEWCKEQGLQLSKTKTEMIYLKDAGQGRQACKLKGTKGYKKAFTTGSVTGSLIKTGKGGVRPPTVKLDNAALKCARCVRYLGVLIGMRMSITEHVNSASAKGKILFSAMCAVARANWGLRFASLKAIYRGVFVPIVLYAIGSWGDRMNKGRDRRLLSAQKYALMRVARAYRTVSVEALQVVCGEIPLDILAKEMHYKYKVRKKEAFRYEDFNFDPEMRPSWAKGQLRRITMQLWQKRWDESTKGRITFEYFSNVSCYVPSLRRG